MPDLARCVERHSLDPDCHVERWARTFLRNDRPTNTLAFLINLTYGIKRTFKHTHRDEKGIQDPLQTLALGSGSCRDFAMLMIEAVRSLGMAARFVSGYLHIPDDGGDGHAGAGNAHARRGVCRDQAHLAIALCRCMNIPARYCTGYLGDIGFAAWFEAYLGGRWYTFDARNNVPRIGRVLVATGRVAIDVAITTDVRTQSPDDPGDAGWHIDVSFPGPTGSWDETKDFSDWRANVRLLSRLVGQAKPPT